MEGLYTEVRGRGISTLRFVGEVLYCTAHASREMFQGQCQKRPTVEAKETYCSVKRDLIVSKET